MIQGYVFIFLLLRPPMEPTTRCSFYQEPFLAQPQENIGSYLKDLYSTVFKNFYMVNRHQVNYLLKNSTTKPILIYSKNKSPDSFVIARRVCLDNTITIEEKTFKVELYSFSNSSLGYAFIARAGGEEKHGVETHFSPETILKSYGITPEMLDGYTSEQED